MGRPRCVRATCDLRTPNRQLNQTLHGASNAGFIVSVFVICYVPYWALTEKQKGRSESEILRRETPSCSMGGAGARRTRIEVAYLTGSESEQSKGPHVREFSQSF